MRKITTFMVLALSSIFSEIQSEPVTEPKNVHSSYGYINLGLGPAPLPLPIFKGGWRVQNGHHGLDLSLDLATLVSVTAIEENIVYLHYFKPNLDSQFYVGGGISLIEVFSRRKSQIYTAPQLIFGKQYRNETGDTRFFQAKVEWPEVPLNASSGRHLGKYPLVTFSYGICF